MKTIETPSGQVAVFGEEFVSETLIETIKTMLSHDAYETVNTGIKSITFRDDGYPKKGKSPILASFSQDAEGIAINLKETLNVALKRAKKNKEINILAAWWLELLLSIGHELHHGVRWKTNKDELHTSKEARKEEETKAEEYAFSYIVDIVKDYNIEPPEAKEEAWFHTQMTIWLKNTPDFEKTCPNIINKVFFTKDEIKAHTFKDFVCLLANEDPANIDWNKPTCAPPSGGPTLDEQLNGKKATMSAEGEISSPEPKAEVEPVPEATPAPPKTMVELAKIAEGVYTKMYNNFFNNCEYNGQGGFNSPENVSAEPMALTEDEQKLFVTCDHHDKNGRWCTNTNTEKGLFGKVMGGTKLPAYEVYMQINNKRYKRLIIPQNPEKKNPNTGIITQNAIDAQNGKKTVYVINPNSKKRWGPKIVDGVYSP